MGSRSGASTRRCLEKYRGVQSPRSTSTGLKIWPTSEDGLCLTYENLLGFLRTEPKIKNATVKGICGESKIKVAPLIAWVGRVEKVWADIVTGSLYAQDGHCFSSTRRKIISKL